MEAALEAGPWHSLAPAPAAREEDLLNIDASAALDGYWADNGGSFVLGTDVHHRQPLVDASRQILRQALQHILTL